MKIEWDIDKFTDKEKTIMNEVLEEIHEYIDEMEKASEKVGKNINSFLFEGDWFLYFCNLYKNTEKSNGEDIAGLELGFIINFDMWVNDSHAWRAMNLMGY
jgi:hypothetical protein